MGWGPGMRAAHPKRASPPDKLTLEWVAGIVLAPRGDSRHTAHVDNPGILGSTIVQTGSRLSEACTGRAPLLGGLCLPHLSGREPSPLPASLLTCAVPCFLIPGRPGATAAGGGT